MKLCKGCNETKLNANFPYIVKSKGYRSARCKLCIREINKAYRDKQNPDREHRISKYDIEDIN